MSDVAPQPVALQAINRSLGLIPAGLKEASLDSPSFRATAVHFADQVQIIENWLDAYIKSISKLVHDVFSVEEAVNVFLQRCTPPNGISEAVLDPDYTLLAMRNFGEGSREWWTQIITGMKKMDSNVVEPIKSFMAGELRNFKDARKYLEQSQKTFDFTLARYVGQSKTKEPSALREDAFQVHETRKAYLRASLDFCLLAPQLRYAIDKLLVKVSSDQWREMRKSRESGSDNFSKWGSEMDRVKGWSREMEAGEAVFRRELQLARRDIAEVAAQASKPSRELEDYNISTVAYLGSKGPPALNVASQGKEERSEKQGWLFLRTISGKPARTTWVRRWFYVKNGIFGWLVQGAQSGGVEESEKIGVLLCNVKPAVQEERRFCFEVKTKNQAVLIQAETQGQLMEWLGAFDVAKNRALEASASDDYKHPGGIDPAFAITQPSIPEFAAKSVDGGHAPHISDDLGTANSDRMGMLPVPGPDGNLATRGSFDVSAPRRSITTREEGESSRDHASRIMQKLDLHRKSNVIPEEKSNNNSPASAGGIASLISASHNILPVSIAQQIPANVPKPLPSPLQLSSEETHTNTLAPSTLANPPAPTNLSKVAVIASGERGIGIGRSDATGGMPSGIMANMWGTSNWGYINRLEKGDVRASTTTNRSLPPSPSLKVSDVPQNSAIEENRKPDSGPLDHDQTPLLASTDTSLNTASFHPTHRKTVSLDAGTLLQTPFKPEVFPKNYPVELKTQEAQFRMLFPNVSRDDKVLLVFRATWNPNDQQEFPGRVYVTQNDIYFYSHHLGLVLITGVSLDSITEVTAAPGKNCDFIFLHLREDVSEANFSRITIKTFLEPLRLLQNRLNYLIDISQSEDQMSLEDIMTALIKMEDHDPTRSPSMESWEDVDVNTPIDDGTLAGKTRHHRDLRHAIHIDKGTHIGRGRKDATAFHLPSHPVVYEPENMQQKAVERQFEISTKALFHVMFGDKSTVFDILYHERRAQRIARGPWLSVDGGPMRREFEFQIDYSDMFRRVRQANVIDYQVIDVMNDHVCYVVTDHKTPWHLPHHKDFMLVSKIVITHVAKSRCKLAIYTKVDWFKTPKFSKNLVERQALGDSGLDALDLADVIADQVRQLGSQGKAKRAVNIFGDIGQQTGISVYEPRRSNNSKRPQIKQRTLTHMVMETAGSFGESAISSVMMWTFAIIRSIWRACSANRIILLALLLSTFINAVFTSKDTHGWWTERNSAKFMKRLGVGPNHMMSKAIYLKDLDNALTAIPAELASHGGSRCYAHFRDIVNVTDMDTSYETAGLSFTEVATRSTAKRLRRTRQNLGSYRHELLVAMRVVNNVEREMIKAEWENWVLDENTRCKKVHLMLQESNRTAITTGKKLKGTNKKDLQLKEEERRRKLADLSKWHSDYCGDCKLEQDLLKEGRKHLAFG